MAALSACLLAQLEWGLVYRAITRLTSDQHSAMQPNAGYLLWVRRDQQWDGCHVILQHLDVRRLLQAKLWWV